MSDKKITTGMKHKSDRTILRFFSKWQRISAYENNNSCTTYQNFQRSKTKKKKFNLFIQHLQLADQVSNP